MILVQRRSNFSSDLEEEEEEEEETTIEEHFARFERDDALLFFKLLVAEDESEVGVVVTANMFTCVWIPPDRDCSSGSSLT